MARQKKSGQSPYRKYGKTPFRYSELYYQWRAAVLRGDESEARRLARSHNARFLPLDTRAAA